MSLNDLAGLGVALLVVAVLSVGGSFVFLTNDDRRTAVRVTSRASGVVLRVSGRWLVHALLLVWVLASWRRVTRNLGLAYADKHAITRVRRVSKKGEVTEKERPKVTYPWLCVRPDSYGVVLTVWTRVGIGRKEFESAAEHLANTWRCRRVHVEQRKPGRITVRGLRRDPLDARLSLPVPALATDGQPSEGRSGDDQITASPIWAA